MPRCAATWHLDCKEPLQLAASTSELILRVMIALLLSQIGAYAAWMSLANRQPVHHVVAEKAETDQISCKRMKLYFLSLYCGMSLELKRRFSVAKPE